MFRTFAPWALSLLMALCSVSGLAAATGTPVNLNTADAATLAREMEGIGESKAKAIVEYRQKNGPFRSVDELALVKGIGAKTLENNRSRLTVGGGAPPRSTAGRSGGAPAQRPAPAPTR